MLSANFEKRVSNAFSRASSTYGRAANVQKGVAEKLVEYAVRSSQYEEKKIASSRPRVLESSILDIACGTGFVGDALIAPSRPRVLESSIIQLDLSEKMCRKAAKAGRNTIAANAQNLPFKDESFDIIYCSMSIQWFPDVALFFQETRKVLKKNGIIAISFPTANSLSNLRMAIRKISPQSFFKLLPDAEYIKNIATEQGLTASFQHKMNVAEEHQNFIKLARNLKETGAYAKENVGFLTRKQVAELAEIAPFKADWEIVYMVFTKA